MSTIKLFADAIETEVTSWPFIERWGGGAFPVTTEKAFKARNGDTIKESSTVPISCEQAPDCTPGSADYYSKLLPNSNYISVAYLEARSDLSPTSFKSQSDASASRSGRVIYLQQQARLAVWLNLQKLGATALDCGGVSVMALYALKRLYGKRFQITPDWSSEALQVDITDATLLPNDPNQVFQPYSYAVNQRIFLNPYGFFGLSLTFRLAVPAACVCLPEYTPLNCITQW